MLSFLLQQLYSAANWEVQARVPGTAAVCRGGAVQRGGVADRPRQDGDRTPHRAVHSGQHQHRRHAGQRGVVFGGAPAATTVV